MAADRRPPTERFGVLLVTGGRTHQENYARSFAADPRCRLVGLTDERDVEPQRAAWNRELADDLGVALIEDIDEALARSDVHIASVCSEPERRGRLGARCARAGKHVYMDKPLCGSLDEAADLVQAVRDSGVHSQMFSLIHQGWAQEARRLVREGKIGELKGIHCDLLFAKGFGGTAPAGRREETYPPRRFTFVDSKRELFTTGVYSLGLLRWLSGREFRKVHATTANYFFREHADNGVEDFGAAVLELEDGITASITAGRIGWSSHPGGGPMRLYLVGTRGSALVDASRPRLEVSDDAPPWLPPRRNPEDPMGFWSSTTKAAGAQPKRAWRTVGGPYGKDDAEAFVDSLVAGRRSEMDVPAAYTVLETLFACYRSAALGKALDLGSRY